MLRAGDDCAVVADLRSVVVVVGIVAADIAARHAVSFALIRSSLRACELGSADFGGTVLSPDELAVSVVAAVCSVVADVVAMESVIYKTKPTTCNPQAPESPIETPTTLGRPRHPQKTPTTHAAGFRFLC